MMHDNFDKRNLRQHMLQRRAALEDRAVRSAAICAQLMALDLYHAARAIHCYLPMGAEVDTWPLVRGALAAGKAVAVPVVRRGTHTLDHSWITSSDLDDLETGMFGTSQPRIYRPCDPTACDLIVVPMLAFDTTCQRLGYGKGHYDRMLAQLVAPTVGVAYAAQAVAVLPTGPFDVPLTAIVTENAVVWKPGSPVA